MVLTDQEIQDLYNYIPDWNGQEGKVLKAEITNRSYKILHTVNNKGSGTTQAIAVAPYQNGVVDYSNVTVVVQGTQSLQDVENVVKGTYGKNIQSTWRAIQGRDGLTVQSYEIEKFLDETENIIQPYNGTISAASGYSQSAPPIAIEGAKRKIEKITNFMDWSSIAAIEHGYLTPDMIEYLNEHAHIYTESTKDVTALDGNGGRIGYGKIFTFEGSITDFFGDHTTSANRVFIENNGLNIQQYINEGKFATGMTEEQILTVAKIQASKSKGTNFWNRDTLINSEDPMDYVRAYKRIYGDHANHPGGVIGLFKKGDFKDNAIKGEHDSDVLIGDDGNDTISGHEGNDFLFGDNGDDILNGESGNDELDGGSGNDHLYGGSGNNSYIYGMGYGNDVLYNSEGQGHVTLLKLHAEDIEGTIDINREAVIRIKQTDERLIFRNFINSPSFRDIFLTYGKGNSIHLVHHQNSPFRNLVGTEKDDQLWAFLKDTNIKGFAGDDVLAGSDGDDHLEGGAGQDQLKGNDGSDILDGGEGNDELYGGTGSDIYIYRTNSGADKAFEYTDGGQNYIDLSELPITAYYIRNGLSYGGKLLNDQSNSSLDLHYVYYSPERWQQYDFITNEGTMIDSEAETSPFRRVQGSEENDHLEALLPNGKTAVRGLGGNDTLSGRAGDDYLEGGAGQDQLKGNDGSDILDGGEGNDILYGGLGDDVYLFGNNYGEDKILDYEGMSTLKFVNNIRAEDLMLKAHSRDLAISHQNNQLLLLNYFHKKEYQQYELVFDNQQIARIDNDSLTLKIEETSIEKVEEISTILDDNSQQEQNISNASANDTTEEFVNPSSFETETTDLKEVLEEGATVDDSNQLNNIEEIVNEVMVDYPSVNVTETIAYTEQIIFATNPVNGF